MDQTPLSFVMHDRKTYDSTCAEGIYCATGHCVHLTIFTNVKVLLPLLIFRRAGKRINIEENSCRDKRVVVKFQQKAWCDEKAIIKWISEEWENVLLNSKSAGSKYADQNSSSGKSFADSSSEDC